MNPLKIIVLGLGNHGHSWATEVVPACSDIAQLVAVVDKNLELFHEIPEDTACFTDLSEALSISKPDLVINVTSPSAHFSTNMEILSQGIAVLCEKPISESPEHAKQLLDYTRKNSSFLMIAENYRYAEIFRKAKEILSSGTLGKIHGLECHFRHFHPDYSQFYHGSLKHPLLMDVTIHHLDLARYLSGEEPAVTDTKESSAPYSWYQDRPANASIYTEMTNNVVFQYSGTLASPASETDWSGNWSIECDNGVLIIENNHLFLIDQEGRHEIPFEEPYTDSRIHLLRETVTALYENRKGQTDIEDNYLTFRWMLACIESAETKRAVSLLPKEKPILGPPLIRNFLDAELFPESIHEGKGLCNQICLFKCEDFQAPIRFLYYSVVPVGCTMGLHQHGKDNEIYILLEGNGIYTANGFQRPVKSGDIMVNNAYYEHSLENNGTAEMKLLVFEVYY